MYDIIKSVIENKRYELTDMLTKIDTIWVQGDLTDEQRTELVALAQQNAQPENGYAPLQEQINKAFEHIEDLEARVAVLEGGEPPEPEEWPEWYAWSGAGPIPWQKDSKCTHGGKRWVSQVDNNIWGPGAQGVPETVWAEHAE